MARIGNSVVPIMAQKLVGANCPYPEGISGTGVPLGAQGTGKAPGNFRSVTGFRSIWEVFNDIAAGVSKISRKLQVSNP